MYSKGKRIFNLEFTQRLIRKLQHLTLITFSILEGFQLELSELVNFDIKLFNFNITWINKFYILTKNKKYHHPLFGNFHPLF